MTRDLYTVARKELLEILRTFRLRTLFSFALYLLLFGAMPALMIGPGFGQSPLAILYWVALPVIVGAGVSINSFAGERERKTLEMLLATCLPDRAILYGKILAGVVYSLVFILLAIAAGWLALNFMQPEPVGFSPLVVLGGVTVGLLVAGLAALLGVLASLRAGTVRQAGRKLTVFYLLVAMPYFALSFLPDNMQIRVFQTIAELPDFGILSVVVIGLILVIAILVILAEKRFQRNELILD